MTVRERALRLLMELEAREGFANLLLSDRVLAEAGEGSAFLTALFYGTVERRLTLDYFIGALASRSPDELSAHTRCALRLGLYQLLFMDIPPHAAVGETVSLGENKGERALLNAVLREAQRKRDDLPMPPKARAARYLSVKYSFPVSTVKRFLALFEEETEALLASFNEVKPLSLNTRSACVRDELLSRFAEDGILAEKTPYAPYGIRVLSSVSPTALYGFKEGLFFVQDEASAIAAAALAPRRGDTVLDLCAAPGGKTFGAALYAAGEGRFMAFDLHESKLSLIKSGAERLGLTVEAAQRDASVYDPALAEIADRVICDVPCSGLGVLGKKPDLRYREVNESLCDLQYTILENASRYLKAGGVLLYSTCTLTREENGDNVRRFLAEHPEFSAVDFALGEEKRVESEDGMLTLLPHKHGTDGFFMAKLEKRC